ncbi:hypothetical protein J3E64_000163 [Sphingobium sp. OAS761]|uniref:phytanoyl-CoA dioxygenase family protein n=1 Tax=Sphingobium sp. OAS761 TaxID=2817901 RepID=UPI00209CC51F|nr:phytanoyl-CoA dioxygenase family protein [Sphingobium sp. OAS761]MCP1468496.1 hypothetical protein [Sphingobium sp. OAS761]
MELNDEPAFHSRYGGLWIDRADWRQQITARKLTPEQANQIENFVTNGFIVLEGAADPDLVDRFRQRIATSFREGNADVLYQRHGYRDVTPLAEPADRLGVRVVDSYVPLTEALDLLSSPALLAFLNLIFEADPLLFQSLSFDQGSQQRLHQDTAYVVVDKPLELAACWIALEDIQPGSGELMYVPGSHRLPDWNFGADRKHWVRGIDGLDIHNEWARHLDAHAAKSEQGIQYFLPKKGDILIWHADLAHGGAVVTVPDLTRQSLVGHFCPQGRTPKFFGDHPHLATVEHHDRLAYCSQYYNLAEREKAAEPEPESDKGTGGMLSRLFNRDKSREKSAS